MTPTPARDLMDKITQKRMQKHRLLAILAVALLIAIIANIGIGSYGIPPLRLLAILGAQIGLDLPGTFSPQDEAIVLAIRLPRVFTGLGVGAGLALAGAALQGLFRNPLAEPGLVGVSAGAALAAVAMIVLGGGSFYIASFELTPYALPLTAFGGGLVATALIHGLARRLPGDPVATMLLVGIAINAVAGAGIGIFQYASDDTQLRLLSFWLMGGLGHASWTATLPALVLISIGGITILNRAMALDAYLLGSAEAGHLGINTQSLARVMIVATALMVGAAVAVSGIISFVGLVVPHLVRTIIGPDHRTVLPASALLGAFLMLMADLLARTLISPAELPIGLVTSALGGPAFLWLLFRYHSGRF
ncbi:MULTISPECIES: iron ABC transporter permease [unclassified Iodidimonas]|uniref:FecCD family ABC transporter permease n=1 Tax=unclassified Iodidimonas TaxID=2626145 RepID=UPI002482B977|nr:MULTISPECIES: iron ABC transporter permease [unclassified Iodidimonas]